MLDVNVIVSVDVDGLKTSVPSPKMRVQAVDRVKAVLPAAAASASVVQHVVKAAPGGAALDLILITADFYAGGAANGVRLLRAAGDTVGIKLQAPILLAGASLLAALPLAADALIFVNDSPDREITIEILVGRAAE